MGAHIVLGDYVACDQRETDFNNSCVFKTKNSVMLLQHFQQPLWEIVPEKVVIVTLCIHNSSVARILKCLGMAICAGHAPSGRDKK